MYNELIDALRRLYTVQDTDNIEDWVYGSQQAMCDAADALEAAEQRIAELMQKEGEWIEVHDWLQIPQEERGTYRCSACGQVMKYPWNYCPNCGAKMKGEKDGES